MRLCLVICILANMCSESFPRLIPILTIHMMAVCNDAHCRVCGSSILSF